MLQPALVVEADIHKRSRAWPVSVLGAVNTHAARDHIYMY